MRSNKNEYQLPDDWEAETLSRDQVSYAAADGAAALDIYLALCCRKELGSPIDLSEFAGLSSAELQIEEHCSR